MTLNRIPGLHIIEDRIGLIRLVTYHNCLSTVDDYAVFLLYSGRGYKLVRLPERWVCWILFRYYSLSNNDRSKKVSKENQNSNSKRGRTKLDQSAYAKATNWFWSVVEDEFVGQESRIWCTHSNGTIEAFWSVLLRLSMNVKLFFLMKVPWKLVTSDCDKDCTLMKTWREDHPMNFY